MNEINNCSQKNNLHAEKKIIDLRKKRVTPNSKKIFKLILQKNFAKKFHKKNSDQKIIYAPQKKFDEQKKIPPKQLEKNFRDTIDEPAINFSLNNLPVISEKEFVEQNIQSIASARASIQSEELKLLIKKMCTTFATNKECSNFFISSGVLKDAKFFMQREKNCVSLQINGASLLGQNLICQKQDLLRQRLSEKSIELTQIAFT